MTRDEFEELLRKELGHKEHAEEEPENEADASMSITKLDLIKISLFLDRADLIIAQVGKVAAEDHDMDTTTDCLMATAGLNMVRAKFLNPILEAVRNLDEEREKSDESLEVDHRPGRDHRDAEAGNSRGGDENDRLPV